MPTVTLEEAQANLPQLIDSLISGERLVVVRDGKPVAEIAKVAPPPGERPRPVFGRGKGTIIGYDPDDKSHLEGFEEYM